MGSHHWESYSKASERKGRLQILEFQSCPNGFLGASLPFQILNYSDLDWEQGFSMLRML